MDSGKAGDYNYCCVCVRARTCEEEDVELLLKSPTLRLYIFILNEDINTFKHFNALLSFE